VPGTARANAPLTLAIEGDGCFGCGSASRGCDVALDGIRIVLTLKARTCELPPDLDCPAACEIPLERCAIPALAPGTYEVHMTGAPPSGGEPRTLVVANEATATSCELPHLPPEEVDLSRYDATCEDDIDCAIAFGGDPCAPCPCPSGAIATSDLAAYEADRREARALCSDREAVACAACAPVKATCDQRTCAMVPGP
jgi:hypothetical protein